MNGYYIVQSKLPYYHNDGSVTYTGTIDKTIVQINDNDVTWLGGDCPSDLDEFNKNWIILKEIEMENK